MKKLIALVLALVIAFGCSSLAFAADATPADATPADAEYSIQTLLDTLAGIFKGDKELADLWDQIEGLFNKVVDYVKNIGGGLCANDVLGAVDDLEAKIEELPIVGDVYKTIKNIINTIKEKIKALYAGNSETEVEETVAEDSVDTGSTSVGIVAFATVSVAAAAAYVCTKKRA